jgi:hypothetical protein
MENLGRFARRRFRRFAARLIRFIDRRSDRGFIGFDSGSPVKLFSIRKIGAGQFRTFSTVSTQSGGKQGRNPALQRSLALTGCAILP